MRIFLLLQLISLLLITGCTRDAVSLPSSPPIAYIDLIFPVEVGPGEKVSLSGHGNSAGSQVVAFRWRSLTDGDLSDKAAFETKSLSEGRHTIFFRVQDVEGRWSDEVCRYVTVIRRPLLPPPVIDFFLANPVRIGTGDASTLSWHVTGATMAYIDQDVGNVPLSGRIKVSPILNRQYTLTASNDGSSSSAAVNILVVPARVGLPVVNTFASEPGNITAGQQSLLQWNVSNAEYVQIDPGIQVHDPMGSVRVTPVRSTVYTITAYNGVGMVTATTQLMVSATPSAGLPDLVLATVGKIQTSEGIRIGYSVENRGTNIAPSSTTRLYANGAYQASDRLGAMAAGESVTRYFNGWLYNPAANIIEVRVDADSNLVESDRANNVKQVIIPVYTVYDFIDNAPTATWAVGYPYRQIKYGELLPEQGGANIDRTGNRTEDSTVRSRILVTWPWAAYSGWIMGDYKPGVQILPGDHVYGIVGLMEGAFGGDVSFWVYIKIDGDAEWEPLVPGVQHTFSYRVMTFSVPVPPKYFGKKIEFSLRVSAERDPFQDWAAWVDAKIIR